MDSDSFALYLKKRGKKPHVIQGLILQVQRFESFLYSERGKRLEEAAGEDVVAFSKELEKKVTGSARKGVRGLALYFHFLGIEKVEKVATELREEAIAKTRTSFRLCEFMGISAEHTALLETVGIRYVDNMLEKGATPETRQKLTELTEIPPPIILELVKLSDLARINGVKAIRARLYHDAGIDTVEKLSAQEPEHLLRLTAEFVERTGFPGIPPLPKEVKYTIQAAKGIPKIVEYD